MNELRVKRMIPPLLAGCLGLAAGDASAVSAGDWIFRIGVTNVNPNDESSALTAVSPNAKVSVDSDTSLGFNFTYMFRDNWGVELLAALPFKHDINGRGDLAPLGKVGETKHLPPTVTLQYHFTPKRNVRPYVGLGINYTNFFDEKATAGISSLKLDSSWGLAAQGGVDIDVSKSWFVNFDLRYINIETTAKTNLGKIDVDINPWVSTVAIGTRF